MFKQLADQIWKFKTLLRDGHVAFMTQEFSTTAVCLLSWNGATSTVCYLVIAVILPAISHDTMHMRVRRRNQNADTMWLKYVQEILWKGCLVRERDCLHNFMRRRNGPIDEPDHLPPAGEELLGVHGGERRLGNAVRHALIIQHFT